MYGIIGSVNHLIEARPSSLRLNLVAIRLMLRLELEVLMRRTEEHLTVKHFSATSHRKIEQNTHLILIQSL
jgi:hypothetical protein